MAGAIMNKVWGLFGMDSAEPDIEDEADCLITYRRKVNFTYGRMS